MRLLTLQVENLGPIESVSLAMPPVTLFLGKNEEGKTFLGLDALSTLRFGTCRGIPVGENHALIRNGTKGFKVAADVRPNPGAAVVSLARTRSQKPDEPTLHGAMGDPRVWASLLDVHRFLDMEADERKALVAGLLANDTDALVEVLVQKNAPEEVLAAARQGNLRKAFRIAEEKRRACDRALTEAETIVKAGAEDPVVVTKGGQVPISTVPIAAIDSGLTKARTAWTGALDAGRADSTRRRVLDEAKAAEQELAKIGGGSPWSDAEAARLAEVVRLLSANRLAAAAAIQERDACRKAAGEIDARLKAKEEAARACPSCEQPLGPEAVKAVEVRVRSLEDRANRAAAANATLSGEHGTLESERKALDTKRTAWDNERSFRARLDAKVKAGAEAGQAPDPVDPRPLEAEVRRLEALREQRIRYDGRADAVASAKDRVVSLTAKRDAAQEVETCCTPDRIDDEDAILAKINAAAAEYAPAVLRGPWVSVTPSWEVTYGGFRHELASDSAAIRVGMVLALALAKVSGVRCVFVDRLEALEGAARTRVVNLLGSLVQKGEIETAILCRIMEEPPAPATLPEWLGRYWIEGGKARAV